MSRIYEMCNDMDSESLLKNREQLTEEERGRLREIRRYQRQR